MTDDRPSIAELQAFATQAGPDHELVTAAAPVLLEIAAAALAWSAARDLWMVAPTGASKSRFTDAATALADVVAGKVRQ